MIDTDRLLPVICLDDDCSENDNHPLPGILPSRPYVLMGQISNLEDGVAVPIAHYIVMDLRTGKIMPGMYHGDRFRFITVKDNIF